MLTLQIICNAFEKNETSNYFESEIINAIEEIIDVSFFLSPNHFYFSFFQVN